MSNSKKYWKSLEELNQDKEYLKSAENEFPEELTIENIFDKSILGKPANRRDFLKTLGFSITAATVAAGCEIPIKKAIPYVIKPDEITPGVANWYASTYAQGGDYCSILVKTREGRPIKIEGNKLSGISQGGTSARVQASVLSLYNIDRLSGPVIDGASVTWNDVDLKVAKQLASIKDNKGNIRILSSTILSPSTKKIIDDFIKYYPSTQHITCDPISYSGMLDSNEKSFGKRIIPGYHFDKADVIVSVGADFLGTWISPVEYTKQYVKGRKVSSKKRPMSKHFQFESGMSLTGTNADERIPINPSQQGVVLLHLYNKIAGEMGYEKISGIPEIDIKDTVKQTAVKLLKSKGRALVVCGSNDTDLQIIVNGINQLLDSYGNTIDLINNPSNQKQGNDLQYMKLIKEMEGGAVDGLILYDINPAYNLPMSDRFKAALGNVKLSISLSPWEDESGTLCNVICPDHHYLESWNDSEPKKGYYSLAQPTIRPLFNTRSAQESLLVWSGNNVDYYSYLKAYWKDNIFPKQNKYSKFRNFWDHTLHDGIIEFAENNSTEQLSFSGNIAEISSKIKITKGLELELYEKIGMGNGEHANNPWLHEMPDPVTKVTWGNYAAISRKLAAQNNLKDGDVATISSSEHNVNMRIPVLIQPGQANNTISVALGYGREKAGKAGNGIGQNGTPFIHFNGDSFSYKLNNMQIEATGAHHELACTQWHHNINIKERPIVRETTLSAYKENPKAGNEYQPAEHHGFVSLYNKRDYSGKGHHWAMAFDLNACTGCGNCIISCQAENNVPVVGKEEVVRRHEMHWMRIDRYYVTTENTTIDEPEENPEVIHQPMLCQHCDQAPCENVCPVAATSHSMEGLNQMAYNRCVGTRYCANNCPYKVRRFNWYDYTGADSFSWNEHIEEGAMANDLSKMVLNPDVTVRSRGVMEKCTFCVQRIQEGKLNAKKEARGLSDGEILTACQQTCPANAIVFGDINDPESEITKIYKDERKYHALEEIHTLPSVGYLSKIRNKEV